MSPPVAPSIPPPEVSRRAITGMSAVLLPFTDGGDIDWDGFDAHLQRTLAAGLVPAVNMDTGYGPDLSPADRQRVLERTTGQLAGVAHPSGVAFVAGLHVDDQPGAALDAAAYRRAADEVQRAGGTPIVFPSFGLAATDEAGWVAFHRGLAESCDRFLGFELGTQFHPAGRILSLDAYRELLGVRACIGAKHSSLRRGPEWDRLRLRDELRPGFLALTGNDLAIDLVTVGSDYLLGLSTFGPDWFAERDRRWAAGDAAGFWQLNDLLQYLGAFAFRPPVPSYKHSAAQMLVLRGQLAGDATPPGAGRRPDSDRDVLADLRDRLDEEAGR